MAQVMTTKVLCIITLILLCCCQGKISEYSYIDVTEVFSYQEYLDQSFERAKEYILILEKDMGDFVLEVEFSDIDSIYSKTWVFDIDTSVSYSENIYNIAYSLDLDQSSDLSDFGLEQQCIFLLLDKKRNMLKGVLHSDNADQTIRLTYYVPIE